jgi:hypothetical protein
MNPKEVYENGAKAIYYLDIESQTETNKLKFDQSITDLHKLLEGYYDLLDHEEREDIER